MQVQVCITPGQLESDHLARFLGTLVQWQGRLEERD
jgi:hypothetical protein